MSGLDRRRNAVRDDLADARLRAVVERPHYAEPRTMVVTAPLVRCHMAPGGEAVDTEFMHGEPVDLFDEQDGWAFVQSTVDRYVGYVPSDALGAPGPAATHVVAVPSALVYAEPTIKKGVRGTLPLTATLAAAETVTESEIFVRISGGACDGAFVLAKHVREVGEAAPADWVAIAEFFVGAPYLWGGKSWGGIDCSGLVQLALQAAGRQAPRDSDMQANELGDVLPHNAPAMRGDLVFFKGHVGIMLDETRFLHANGHHMMTAVEPLEAALARLSALGLPVTVRRRLLPPDGKPA